MVQIQIKNKMVQNDYTNFATLANKNIVQSKCCQSTINNSDWLYRYVYWYSPLSVVTFSQSGYGISYCCSKFLSVKRRRIKIIVTVANKPIKPISNARQIEYICPPFSIWFLISPPWDCLTMYEAISV